MKSVLIVLAVLLVAAALFFLVGLLSPGQENETVVKINSPLEYTWDLYHDDNVLKEWVPGLQDITLTSGKEAEVGSTYQLSMKDHNDKLTTMDEKITAFDPNKKYGMDYSNDMLDGHVDVLFAAVGDSTMITSTNHYKGKTPLLRSMFHFFNGKIKSETDHQYENFKLIVEERYMKHLKNQQDQNQQNIQMQSKNLTEDGLEN